MNNKIKQALENVKNIKVGTMVLNDLFGEDLKVIEKALEERKKLLKWKDSQKDLIKGKDEYIAKLCNDRAELKEHEKELIAEQHRLFDLAKEQENEIKTLIAKNEEMSTDRNKARNENFKLKEFMRIVFEKNVFIWGMAYRKNEVKDYKPTYEYYKNHCGYFHSGYKFKLMTETEFDLVKKVVEKYEK